MRKSLMALMLGASMLYGCKVNYTEYQIDGNKVEYRRESSQGNPFLCAWDIVEKKKNHTKIKYYFLDNTSCMSQVHVFKIDGKQYNTKNSSEVSSVLENRLQYLLHKIDSIDKDQQYRADSIYKAEQTQKRDDLIRRINE